MTRGSDDLYSKLKASYTESNLHKIAHNLIRLYRDKQFEKLQFIAELLSEGPSIGSITDKQGFSKLITVYHPDRYQYYQNELNKYELTRDPAILHPLEPILQILNIEEIVSNIEVREDIDYDPEFMWDINPEFFTYIDLNKKATSKRKFHRHTHGCSFYDALKDRYGSDIDPDYTHCYLKNVDELEMAESRISNLEGIEYCINTVNMDLSGNLISDLTPLFGLIHIEELNLSDNCISDIDVLATLQQLRSLNLSNNPVHDVSPLLELDTLENLDISGNSISVKQIRLLEQKGVVVNVD